MHLVQEIGSYAGFGAVVGLAVLSALYFSQARDVKRLREWAGRAPERAAEEESRIAAQAQSAQTQGQQQRAAAAASGGAATVAAPAVRPQTGPASPTPPPSGVPTPPPPTLPTSRPTAAPAPSTPILNMSAAQQPWYKRVDWPAPRYIVLIVVGVLVIGAGAVYGIEKATNDSGSSSGNSGSNVASSSGSAGNSSSSSSQSKKSHNKATPLNPKSITVAVLNVTTVTGLAATTADKVEQEGFTRGNTDNALTQGQQAESVVEYSKGNKRAADLVAKKLNIGQTEPIDPATQSRAGDATVAVIIGADLASGSG
jgi:hypothetical protein